MTVTAEDFDYVRRLVADESALALTADKGYLVDHRLAPVAERRGLQSVRALIAAVRAGEPDLRREVVEALSTHETRFFRDEHPFETLRERVVPELMARSGGRIDVWSAATSTGQEAYSLALLLRESRTPARLLATDLSQRALRRARAGRFDELEVRRGLPAAMRDRWFDPCPGGWRAREDLRSSIQFRQLNLARPFRDVVGAQDLVLLRNVLIYFGAAARRAVLTQITAVLRPGGYLLLGGSESVDEDRLIRVHHGRTILYRRREVPS